MSLDTTGVQLKITECYEFTLSDGSTIARFTSHVSNLTFLTQTFQAIPIKRSKVEYHDDLQVDAVDITLGLIGVTIGSQFYSIPTIVRMGLLRNAHIKVWKVDYTDTSKYRIVFEGWVTGESNYNRESITLNTGSILDRMDEQFPQVLYTPHCNLNLFATRCGVAKASYKTTSAAAAGTSARYIYSAVFGFGVHAAGYWERGEIKFTSGVNNGVQRTVLIHSDGYVKLIIPLYLIPTVGDTFDAYPGCDKSGTTCVGRFGNYNNYFGFEYIPPPEYLYD